MKLSEMSMSELEIFEFLNKKLEVATISTEELRKVINNAKKGLDAQEKSVGEEIVAKKKYLNELEKIISVLDKGTFKK